MVDLLPAGLELENPNLSNSSINIQSIPELANVMNNNDSSDIKHQEYRDDRYVAAIDIHNIDTRNRYHTKLIYLARAVSLGDYVVPSSYVESMYKPEWFAIGNTPYLMTITAK